MSRRAVACLLALPVYIACAACADDSATDGVIEPLPDASPPPPIELVVNLGLADDLTASLDGVALTNWAPITRTLPGRAALFEVELELIVSRGDETGSVVVRSVCTDTDFHQWRDGVLVRETLNTYVRWPAGTPAPYGSSSGACEFADGVVEGWAP